MNKHLQRFIFGVTIMSGFLIGYYYAPVLYSSVIVRSIVVIILVYLIGWVYSGLYDTYEEWRKLKNAQD